MTCARDRDVKCRRVDKRTAYQEWDNASCIYTHLVDNPAATKLRVLFPSPLDKIFNMANRPASIDASVFTIADLKEQGNKKLPRYAQGMAFSNCKDSD